MPSERQLRRLANVRLTRQFHWRYMGLWVVLTILLCLVFNVICYRLVEWSSARLYTLDPAELDAYLRLRELFLVGLAVEAVVVSTGVLALGVFTAHRVAGPYLHLCAAFDEIARGNFAYRLRFRSYDHLQIVEDAFARMTSRIQADCTGRERDPHAGPEAQTGGP